MTDATKANLAKARKDAAAKKKDVEGRLAATNAKLDSVMAMLAKLTAAPQPAVVAPLASAPRIPDAIIPPSAQSLGATRSVEAAYIVMTRVGPQRDRVNIRIDDPEDVRWEGMLMQTPYNGDPRGSIEVATVTRVDGEIVKQAPIAGGPRHMNVARSFLQQFCAAKSAGAEKPWDLERWYRDRAEEEKRLKREGRAEELLAMRELLVAAVKGSIEVRNAT